MKVVIAGGGTTGHLSPGLAVAAELTGRGHEVVFIGSAKGPERRIVIERGYSFEAIQIIGRGPGVFSARNLRAGVLLAAATARSVGILRRLNASAVLATGGYVSLPASFAAGLTRTALVLHEQNSVPGVANRAANRFATKVAVSFEGTQPRFGSKAVLTGNPVRPEIANLNRPQARPRALEHFQLQAGRPTLLVFGGSQGATSINEAMLAAYPRWRARSIQVLHLTGAGNSDQVAGVLAGLRETDDKILWRAIPYSDRMELAYSVADLAICRAGASTIAELAACKLPSLLIPLPGSLDDDQRHNAEAVVQIGGAKLLAASTIDSERLAESIDELLADQVHLAKMGEAVGILYKPRAACDVADLVLEAAVK